MNGCSYQIKELLFWYYKILSPLLFTSKTCLTCTLEQGVPKERPGSQMWSSEHILLDLKLLAEVAQSKVNPVTLCSPLFLYHTLYLNNR